MEEKKIYSALNDVMKDIGFIGKNQQNSFSNYKFRGIDDVMNALHPALQKNGVTVTPNVINITRDVLTNNKGTKNIYTILTIRYDFFAVDGSSVSATVIGEAFDSGDKSANKAMAVAFKYAMFQVFCIPTEEMKDSDSNTAPPLHPHCCDVCGNVFESITDNGTTYTSAQIYEGYKKASPDGIVRCQKCMN